MVTFPPPKPPNIGSKRWPFMIGTGTVYAVVTKHSKVQCFLVWLPSNTSIHLDKSKTYVVTVKADFRPQLYIAPQYLQKRLSPETMETKYFWQLSIWMLIKDINKTPRNTPKPRKNIENKKQYSRSLRNHSMEEHMQKAKTLENKKQTIYTQKTPKTRKQTKKQTLKEMSQRFSPECIVVSLFSRDVFLHFFFHGMFSKSSGIWLLFFF